MMQYAPWLLHTKIATLCPIDGISLGDLNDPTTWRIDFSATATPQQIAAVNAKLALITPAKLAQVEASMQAAVAALPNPLASATAAALTALG